MKHKKAIATMLTGVMLAGSVGSYHSVGYAKLSTEKPSNDEKGKDEQEDIYKELSDAQQEKLRLEERKAQVEESLAGLETEKQDLMETVEALDEKMAEAQEKLDEVNASLEGATQELYELSVQLQEAMQTEKNQYDTMKKRIKYMYENGSQGYLDILFSAGSIGELLNRMEYVNKITSYDNEMLGEYTDTKNEVIQKKTEAADKKEQLETLQEEAALEEESLEKLIEKKRSKLEAYEENIENMTEEAAEYAEEIAKKEAEIDAIILKQAGDGNIFSKESADGFIWPLSVKGRISSKFGKRSAPKKGASTYHKGVDIAAPQGTSIFAVADGKVVTAKYSSTAGNYIMVKHKGGYTTVYMHCMKLCCKVGDEVSQGDLIGLVGSTGISTGAHLHFGLIAGGNYIDPLDYLPVP